MHGKLFQLLTLCLNVFNHSIKNNKNVFSMQQDKLLGSEIKTRGATRSNAILLTSLTILMSLDDSI